MKIEGNEFKQSLIADINHNSQSKATLKKSQISQFDLNHHRDWNQQNSKLMNTLNKFKINNKKTLYNINRYETLKYPF